jgi:hypothetical protein
MGKWMYKSTLSDLGTSWRWVVSFTPLPLYPRWKSPRYPLDRRLGGPQSQSGRRGEGKFFTLPRLEHRSLGRPARSQSLYRLSYPGSSYDIILYYIIYGLYWFLTPLLVVYFGVYTEYHILTCHILQGCFFTSKYAGKFVSVCSLRGCCSQGHALYNSECNGMCVYKENKQKGCMSNLSIFTFLQETFDVASILTNTQLTSAWRKKKKTLRKIPSLIPSPPASCDSFSLVSIAAPQILVLEYHHNKMSRLKSGERVGHEPGAAHPLHIQCSL